MEDEKAGSEKRSKGLIQEYIREMGVAGKLMRARAIEEQITDIEQELIQRRDERKKQEPKSFARAMNEKMILALIAQRKKLVKEFTWALGIMVDHATGKIKHEQNGCTQEEIDRANSHPIENLIEVRRGVAKCISGSHSDKHPSMDVRNNFAYCYACGYSGDVISVAQKLYGLSFQDAVRRLQ